MALLKAQVLLPFVIWICLQESAATTCGSTIYGTSGQIVSPNYPNSYANNLRCEWNVSAAANYWIAVNATTFSVEKCTGCSCDRLTFHVVNRHNHCGTGSRYFVSTSNFLRIVFETDGDSTRQGFQLLWKRIIPCRHRVSGSQGTLTSPNYPGNYDNYYTCIWEITVTSGIVALEFTAFHTETSSDMLEVRDAYQKSQDVGLSGLRGTFTVRGISNKFELLFRTDSSRTYSGWKVNWFAITKLLPTSVVADNGMAGCVNVSWSPPYGSSAVNVSYEVNYNNFGWTSVGELRTDMKCGLSPYQLLNYAVRVVGAPGMESGSARSACAAPSKPRTLSTGVPLLSCQSGTPRWLYNAIWEEPEDVNCGIIIGYITRFPAADSSPVIVDTTSRGVYTSLSAADVTFHVAARNNNGDVSELTSTRVTTPDIGQNLTLCKPTSSSYTYKNTGYESWRAVDGDITGRSYFRSANSGSQWWKLDLQQKYFVQEIKVYNVLQLASKLQLATVYVSTNDNPSHPRSGDWNQVMYQKHQISSSLPNNYIEYDPVAASKIINFARHVAVYSTHTGGLAIDDVQVKVFITDEFKPTNLTLHVTQSRSFCVTLNWGPPNGDIRLRAIYEVNCQKTDWTTNGELRKTEKCGFPPNQIVACQVRVKGSTGYVEKEIKIPCDPPTIPRMLSLNTPSLSCKTGRSTWKYNATWQIPQEVNCDSITNYIIKFPGDSSSRVSHYATNAVVYTNPSAENIIFSVSARNNGGNESRFTSVTTTTPRLETSVTLCKPTLSSSVYRSTGYESWRAVDGDITGTSFFRSAYSSPQWWTVDLEKLFFIREIRVYNVKDYSSNLRKVGVYLSYKPNPAEPPAGADWSLVLYQDSYLTSLPPDNYIKYDPVDESHSIRLARHFALYSTWTYGMVVAEVQIQALNIMELKPTSLNLNLSDRETSDLSSCVTMNWEPPINATGVRVSYETKYHNFDWKLVGEKRTDERCGLNPSEQWICRVRVVGAIGEVSELIGFQCAAPSKPRALSIKVPLLSCHNGTPRWLYNAMWEEPVDVNCGNISGYITRFPAADSSPVIVDTTSIVVYTSLSAADVNFYVSARNDNGDVSEFTSIRVTTPDIGRNLTLCKPTSSSSMYRSTGYENWRAVDGDVTGRSYFRSMNSGPQWWRVDLQQGYFIQHIKVYNVHLMVSRLQLTTIYVSGNDRPSNPRSSGWSQVMYQKSSITPSPPTHYIQYDPVAASDIIPFARHVAVYTTYTGGLAIDDVQVWAFPMDKFKPTNLTLHVNQSHSFCVTLRWDPPNGDIRLRATYEANCNERDWTTIGELRNNEQCGFPPNQLVTCQVRVKGATDYVEKEIKVPCASPTVPRMLSLNTPSLSCKTGRPTWNYNVTWQIPQEVNCDSIANYIIRFPGDSSSTVSNYATNAVVYTNRTAEDITFSVSARNNGGNESRFTSVTATTPRLELSVTTCKPTSSSSVFNSAGYQSWRAVDGDITGTTYFRTLRYAPQWWVVDLQEPIFIRRIKVFNVKDYRVSLQKVGVYLSNRQKPGVPPAVADWYLAKYQSDYLTSSPPDNYITYDPVDESHIIRLARQIALYSTWTNGMVVAEVQIQALDILEFKPTNLNLNLSGSETSDPASCVTINWEPPNNATGVRVSYETKYHNFDWKLVGEKRTDKRCGLSPDERWICRVRVVGAVGDVYGLVGAQCVEPSAPNTTVEEATELSKGGYERVKIMIQWQESDANCEFISRYEINITSGSTLLVQTTTAGNARKFTIGNLDPVTDYTIMVRAVNNENLTQDMELKWLTRALKPANLPVPQLSFNATCVSMNISRPLRPNGVVTHYTVGCHRQSETAEVLTNVTTDIVESQSLAFCNFTSTSKITCKVSAWNAAGESQYSIVHGYTRHLSPAKSSGAKSPICSSTCVIGISVSGIFLVVACIVGVCIHIFRRKSTKSERHEELKMSPARLNIDYADDPHHYDECDSIYDSAYEDCVANDAVFYVKGSVPTLPAKQEPHVPERKEPSMSPTSLQQNSADDPRFSGKYGSTYEWIANDVALTIKGSNACLSAPTLPTKQRPRVPERSVRYPAHQSSADIDGYMVPSVALTLDKKAMAV